jgi:predicted HicB family RNase H-like nuclease
MNTKAFILRLSPELRARLEEQATEKGLTLTAYIRMILTEKARLGK